ncbi:MAG: Glycosyl transferase group 2 family protein [Candidatus Wolfebacteria bacterium GW2011_GWC2_46_275]|uniref:Glycosyl transferase group 2 family protein n=2 Tax=Candidatus Wolfeibacteriota TaxID=1752735 RepID=A0A0G1U5L1_9BACT|nr:MAG: family 2 glycosyl transferase [Candidatus Wolfebacteria bacterium GW2011_GWB1_47_1]KKU36635.1 MAG: Glycosyl transferase group 2 family protein [Candidatus Wolfebacteria bacterium GW2011_GWC2_46_275]KKU41467.1 MAG: Glycosyl transferase group 2 family protein [Candidatus Wolfebacteria bacterium GW2011_GWB2_46_69]KKU53593.1 MAG: Glycosyl transferase group 2 family protein [Candidatus Wolfebacteria bacterium GW2011_GWC1_47_103]KKU58825.1 MAG: Glycosyl transferase group 2 family protein [Can
MKDVAIQIVNYNTKKYLIDCIDGVFSDLRGTDLRYEVLVLDNASNDDLGDLHDRYGDKVLVSQSEKNKGFGGGHNDLAGRSNAPFLLIINPDIQFVEPKTIERLMASMRTGENCAVIGPKLVMGNGIVQEWDHGELRGLRAWVANRIGSSYWKERDRASDVAWVSGAFFLIRRDIFEQVGGFDENFFLYKEEEDLCLRIRQKGMRIKYDPAIRVIHYGSVVASKDMYMEKSIAYFKKKHATSWLSGQLAKLIHKLVK